jgi:hypothetical protein
MVFGLKVVSVADATLGVAWSLREMVVVRVCPDAGVGMGTDGGGGSGVTGTFLARTYPSLPETVLTFAHNPSMLRTVTCQPGLSVMIRWEEAGGAVRRLLLAVMVENVLAGEPDAGDELLDDGTGVDEAERPTTTFVVERNEDEEEPVGVLVTMDGELRVPLPPPPPVAVILVDGDVEPAVTSERFTVAVRVSVESLGSV